MYKKLRNIDFRNNKSLFIDIIINMIFLGYGLYTKNIPLVCLAITGFCVDGYDIYYKYSRAKPK